MLAALAHRRRTLTAVLAVMLALSSTPSVNAQTACDSETNARLTFLEARLDEGRRHASWWWNGWLAVFSVGAVVQGTKAALSRFDGHDGDLLVSTGKSLLGVTDLRRHPLIATDGADAVRAIPTDSPGNCARRLALAERTLARAAEEAETRDSWTRHLGSLAFNLGTAALVAGVWDDGDAAWQSFELSQPLSEGHILSQPWRASDDWHGYRTKFDGAPAPAAAPQLSLGAGPGGIGVLWAF
ncbi:MAG: hypothetical protein HY899_19365 [Deltaproteobacteria bacterium]|nr:hypothetical protein [Deltaproteobacteria bacterium]